MNLAAGYDLVLAAGASATFTDVAEIVTVANITPDGYVINHVVGFSVYGSWSLTKEADARCKIDQGATRTPGFWQTHVSYTTHIFRDALGSHIDLGWRQLTTKEQVFNAVYGAFTSDVDESVIEGHISKLRKKLRQKLSFDPIEVRRYLGYAFVN